MIAEEPVIPSDARRHMVDGTYGGVAKEQVFIRFSIQLWDASGAFSRHLSLNRKFWKITDDIQITKLYETDYSARSK